MFSNHKTLLMHFFLGRCNLEKDRIKELYEKGGPEAYESTGIFFFKQEVRWAYCNL